MTKRWSLACAWLVMPCLMAGLGCIGSEPGTGSTAGSGSQTESTSVIRGDAQFVNPVARFKPRPYRERRSGMTAEVDSCSTPVQYNNGALVQNARVTSVVWGSSVNASVVATMPGFYRDLLTSPFIDWLSEYSAGGQTIGRGSFWQTVVTTPHNTGTSLSDGDVQAELAWQMDHALVPYPSPDGNDVYVILLPPGVCAGETCPPTNACGYHESFTHAGTVRYVVTRDLSSDGCAGGVDNTPVNQVMDTVSHELVETITDPDPWNGWVGGGCEIGDICESLDDVHLHTPEIADKSYIVQPSWSNAAGACIAQSTPNKSDILWRDSDANVAIWFMNGGSIGSTGNPSTVLPSSWQVKGTGDFDGDGVSDVLWRNSDGTVKVWLMNGSTITSSGNVSTVPGLDWQIAGTGDFNGDGRSDVLWRDSDGTVAYWYMSSYSIASQATFSTPGSAWQIQGVGDFDGNLLSDVVWRNTSTGAVQIWFNQVTGVPTETVLGGTPPGLDWTIAGTGDFDGNGKSDILWRDSDGQVAIWLDGDPTQAVYPSTVPGTDWQIEGTGDFDGDGNSDILWRDSDNTVAIWLMSGATILSQGFPGAPGSDWVIQGTGAY